MAVDGLSQGPLKGYKIFHVPTLYEGPYMARILSILYHQLEYSTGGVCHWLSLLCLVL